MRALSSLMVPLSVLVANASGLAIQLLLPRFLLPTDYAEFAGLWAMGMAVAALAYEWLRFGVIRFAVGSDADTGERRRTLAVGYLGVTALMLAVGAGGCVVATFGEAGPWVALTALFVAAQGLFEGRQALARAEFRHRTFSLAWNVRSLISLVCVLLSAWYTRSGMISFLALSISYIATGIVLDARSIAALRLRDFSGATQFRFVFRFGFFAAMGAAMTAFAPALVRLHAAVHLTDGRAGGLLLGLDLAQKAIAVAGMAVNIVVMQRTIHAAEFGNPAQMLRQNGLQIAAAFSVVLPAAVGFQLMQPLFAQHLVPAAYRDSYDAAIPIACAASALICLRLFALDPLFVAARRTDLLLISPVVVLVFTIGSLAVIDVLEQEADIRSILLIVLFSNLAGLVTASLVLFPLVRVAWPLVDMAKAVVATVMMAVPIRALLSPTSSEIGIVILVAGAFAYATTALALDLCGVRTLLFKPKNSDLPPPDRNNISS